MEEKSGTYTLQTKDKWKSFDKLLFFSPHTNNFKKVRIRLSLIIVLKILLEAIQRTRVTMEAMPNLMLFLFLSIVSTFSAESDYVRPQPRQTLHFPLSPKSSSQPRQVSFPFC